MSGPLPLVLVPGLLCSPRLYADQIPALWRYGPVTVADHTRDDSMAALARRILEAAPPKFALLGLSMGGYVAFEIMRQVPDRIARLALLDTAARPDTPEQSDRRRAQVSLAREGRLAEVAEQQLAVIVHPDHRGDERLRRLVLQMAEEVGVEAFARQQAALIGRPDSRPGLSAIGCPTLVLVGDGDQLTPPDRAEEIADGIPGSRLVVVAQCGHLSTLEQPAAVTRALEQWLEG